MTIEEKWDATREKVEHLLRFPGLIKDWKDAAGKRIARVVPIDEGKVLLLFDDKTFAITLPVQANTLDVQEALESARPALEATHREALRALDRLIVKEKDLQKRARLEKILGAIRNNAAEIPELKEAVRKLLEEL